MDWRNIPSLAALRAFESAARLKNFSAAARELNVTHAAIAQHVRGLEARFSQSLIERHGRLMEPTEAGRRLADTLSDGFGTIEAGIKDLISDATTRPLTISTTPSFAENWLMPRLGAFWADRPGLEISIVPTTKVLDLKRGQIDFAIRYGGGNWPGHKAERLTQSTYVIACSPKFAEKIEFGGPSDLSKHVWLIEQGHPEQRLWAEAHGINLNQSQITTFATNTLVLSATRQGYGLSIQAYALVESDLKNGTLVSVFQEDSGELGYYIVTRENHMHPSLAPFIDWLRCCS
ncbi:LysR family transcriptional regulator [Pseudohalocynthiibacter aestuariivivens]|jgi:LysR family transcriptional regulator, glycine cleavage system transcriptional activator|uniref:LysR family transcriptional regulator n=1 Tax=Pseudohalocynthiibacter aestuariivivens TaxID=1591409 RepID=A0ABV5JK15_9RHOB|nr:MULTISPECIES: LysR family transcriptional regulator [Pseudohalocynthiibacter]MBS9717682.1 LysR family transcriptional regulator [Pseudohalocynthiibacter aestuariivivens]MCK0102880.1 LysR family transcriptional regulator [Pseudohalocynthiibacter sp. F2068]